MNAYVVEIDHATAKRTAYANQKKCKHVQGPADELTPLVSHSGCHDVVPFRLVVGGSRLLYVCFA